MSNWLGFSLTPHLRIHDVEQENGFEKEGEQRCDQQQQNDSSPTITGGADDTTTTTPMSIMPLRSDGSLCNVDSFSLRSSCGLHHHQGTPYIYACP